jgi:hypothetical protein
MAFAMVQARLLQFLRLPTIRFQFQLRQQKRVERKNMKSCYCLEMLISKEEDDNLTLKFTINLHHITSAFRYTMFCLLYPFFSTREIITGITRVSIKRKREKIQQNLFFALNHRERRWPSTSEEIASLRRTLILLLLIPM